MTLATWLQIVLSLVSTEPGAHVHAANAALAYPVVVRAHRLEGDRDYRASAITLWKECSFRLRCPRGARGEWGAAQILPSSGKLWCKGLRWRRDPVDNVRCSLKIRKHYRSKGCKNQRAAYRGLCKRKRG